MTSIRSMRVDDRLWARISELGEQRGVPASSVVTLAIIEYLHRHAG